MASVAFHGPLRDWSHDLRIWLVAGPGRRVAVAALLVAGGLILFAAGDKFWLGLAPWREEPPRFDAYHIVQSVFGIAVTGHLVRSLLRTRSASSPLATEPMRSWEVAAGLASLTAAAAATALFLVDAAAFHAFAQEDRPLEWASSLLPLFAAAVLGWKALRYRRDRVVAVLALGLAFALLLVGMEEISWGQRVLGFATPEGLAEMNWQAEFNLHNVQTDLSETVYYFGAGSFLLVLPLLRDLLPRSVAEHPWLALAPRRSVALVSAPIALFNYGHWDLFAVQLTSLLGFWAMLGWSAAARRGGSRTAAVSWMFAALTLAIGQALFLALGHLQLDVPDATEYKEFFIALGFAWYAAMASAPRNDGLIAADRR